jgi:hypothetical protein
MEPRPSGTYIPGGYAATAPIQEQLSIREHPMCHLSSLILAVLFAVGSAGGAMAEVAVKKGA